jgi:cytoskeletal protein RodZ
MKRYAGPTPAGTYVTRGTPNDYSHAVAVIDKCETIYKPRDPAAVNGYVPNPMLGQWVSSSWHYTQAAAQAKATQHRNNGRFDVVVVPVLSSEDTPVAANGAATTSERSTMSSTAEEQQQETGVVVEAPAKAKPKARKAPAKKAPAKKAAAKAPAKKASTPRSKFPVLKTEAACEKVMKANLAGYKQYQVERDKNRNERGMAKHRDGYRTYKNAYTQLLALRKASGKGRRNAKAAS